MEKYETEAIIVEVADELRERGSWSGETHLQKAFYFLQEVCQVPVDLEFVLYKHGPFSFELRELITDAINNAYLEEVIKPRPYGPTLISTEKGLALRREYCTELDSLRTQILSMAECIRDKRVVELERIATALYVTRKNGSREKSLEERAKEIHGLKPHISVKEAKEAVESVDGIIANMCSPA